jgi:hypothetical protein
MIDRCHMRHLLVKKRAVVLLSSARAPSLGWQGMACRLARGDGVSQLGGCFSSVVIVRFEESRQTERRTKEVFFSPLFKFPGRLISPQRSGVSASHMGGINIPGPAKGCGRQRKNVRKIEKKICGGCGGT